MNFASKRPGLMKLLSDMEQREVPYSDILEFFDGNKEILFAVMIQIMMHPKNSNRTEAIRAGTYVEIESIDQSRAFCSNLVKTHLGNELR